MTQPALRVTLRVLRILQIALLLLAASLLALHLFSQELHLFLQELRPLLQEARIRFYLSILVVSIPFLTLLGIATDALFQKKRFIIICSIALAVFLAFFLFQNLVF